MKMRSAEEWAQDVLFEWLMTDPYPTKPGIEKPSDHEERQRKMMTDIIAGKMRDYARECVEAYREKAAKHIYMYSDGLEEDVKELVDALYCSLTCAVGNK